VHVDDVERQRRERLLDRARDVDRQRCRAPPRRREREHLADPEHQRLSVGPLQERLRMGADRATAVAHQRARLGRRDDQNPVPASGQLAGHAGDVLIDLVDRLPGERRHLRDREALSLWHGNGVYGGRSGARPRGRDLAARPPSWLASSGGRWFLVRLLLG
jgi:hypothetical protein